MIYFSKFKEAQLKPRIYVDTSVVGGCLDQEFTQWSTQFIKEVTDGFKIALISDLTLDELSKAPTEVNQILLSIPDEHIEYVFLSEESKTLAQEYLKHNVS